MANCIRYKARTSNLKKINLVSEVNTTALLIKAIQAGLGMGELPTYYAEKEGLVRLFPHKKRQDDYCVWLAYHQDLAKNDAVRKVIDAIIKVFSLS